MSRRAVRYRWEELPLDKVTEMVTRKTIVGAHELIAQLYLKKGTLVPLHTHGGEQMLYVLQGALRALVEGDETTVREGEVLVIDAGAAHQAEALDDTFVLSIRGTAAAPPNPA